MKRFTSMSLAGAALALVFACAPAQAAPISTQTNALPNVIGKSDMVQQVRRGGRHHGHRHRGHRHHGHHHRRWHRHRWHRHHLHVVGRALAAPTRPCRRCRRRFAGQRHSRGLIGPADLYSTFAPSSRTLNLSLSVNRNHSPHAGLPSYGKRFQRPSPAAARSSWRFATMPRQGAREG